MPPADYAYHNGKIVPWCDATMHVFSLAGKYGIGVFEGIRGYWNEKEEQLYLFRLKEHFERYAFSQKAMRFDRGPGEEELTTALVDLCKANQIKTTVHIRMMAYVMSEGDIVDTGPVGTAITALPRPRTAGAGKGASAQISSWMRMPDNVMPARIKCNANYHNSRLAAIEAKENGYDAGFLLNSRGKLSEAPAMCVFIVRKGQLITPGSTSDILESITRQTVMQIAEEYLDVKTVERDVDRTELILADEVFYVGTGAEVTPVTSIDRIPIGNGRPGSLTTRIQDLYFSLANGENKGHPDWRLSVW